MRKIILLFFISLFYTSAFTQNISQQVISSSGGDGQSSKATLSWTLGEPVIATYAPKLTQGFHQGDLKVEKKHDDRYVDPELNKSSYQNISAYPNPTSGLITLNMEGIESFADYSYNIFDIAGRLINHGLIESQQTQIDFSSAISGIYIIVVNGMNKPIKEFKIIKND